MGREIISDEKNILKSLGEQLRQKRKNKKLTLNEMAKQIHISANDISLYERGKKDISLLTLTKFCNFFKIKMYNLFYKYDEPNSTEMSTLINDLDKSFNQYRSVVLKIKNKFNIYK